MREFYITATGNVLSQIRLTANSAGCSLLLKGQSPPCPDARSPAPFIRWDEMNRKTAYLISGMLFALLPITASAQCKDQLCSSVQNILDAAVIDFKGYQSHTSAPPDISSENARVPCQMTTWANNVLMCICYAQVAFANGTSWYARTMDALKSLNPSWHFTVKSPGVDHYVDAGPPDCEITPTEGPYIGQCPLHLEVAKQSDGSAKLYLMMNSLSSPYLMHHIPLSPSKPAPSAPSAVGGGCDEFCQSLKKAFEARASAFEDIHTTNSNASTLKLGGAKDCMVNAVKVSPSVDSGTQFVCYWQEASASAAEARFRDLVSRFQVLVPSNWSTRQENELDEPTGVNLTAWHAVEPGNKHDVRVYLSGDSVGLHITAWK